MVNNQSIQATLGDQCIGHILEEDAANHSTIAFPPMCTKLDKVAAQISFSRIHHAVEGDMIFCHPIGNQVFWDRTTSKCCKKDILKLCQHLKVHRFMQQDFPFCIPNTEPFTKHLIWICISVEHAPCRFGIPLIFPLFALGVPLFQRTDL